MFLLSSFFLFNRVSSFLFCTFILIGRIISRVAHGRTFLFRVALKIHLKLSTCKIDNSLLNLFTNQKYEYMLYIVFSLNTSFYISSRLFLDYLIFYLLQDRKWIRNILSAREDITRS